ncbi:MAG: class I tRNA ligase family protein [Thermoguttaceae bacterium]|nr:class I tRNA ligase family protein [Thermoguttaceae bacterium]
MSNQEQLINDLPSQYDHLAAQERQTKFWEEKGFFHSDVNPNKRPYAVVIPPPNVTGALHLAHALNDSLQDTLVRMKRMQGFETLWVPGVDHAGIATQAIVEKRLLEQEGKTRWDLGREALVQRIWDWKDQYQARILSQLKAMGCSCDWRRMRFTLDDVCAKAVRAFFFKLFDDGLIYRGKRLVNWDVNLQTAVSDDEVFHETTAGHFWYLNYPVVDPQPGEPEFVTIATTRPETMLGDVAVAVHPDPEAEFSRIESELREKIVSGSERDKEEAEKELEVLSLRRTEILPTLVRLAAMAGAGRKVILPIQNREIPLITDIWAKPDKGTGVVKITPAHDPNDYEVGLRQNLPMVNLLNRDGTYNENAGKYEGLPIKKVRAAILEDLEAQGFLVKVEDRTIEIATSDRSKTAIEPYLNDQWFVKMDGLSQTAMDAVTSGEVEIKPTRYIKGYLDWLSEKRDWPIGRQLWWGHQIPIWYCPDVDESVLKTAFAGREDVLWRRNEADDGWLLCSLSENLKEDAVAGCTIERDEDVLDTWFSSALWPHSTLGWPDKTPELEYYYPTSALITSRDIISLWVARMVLAGYYNTGKKPFDQVYIHPKILDKYGEGMSKSKGNGVDPVAVMEKFGADALRFALVYLTTENQDVRLALDFECPHCSAVVEQTKKNRTQHIIECPKCKQSFATQWAETPEERALPLGPVVGERFEVARNFCNKLWNASRFVMINLEGFQPCTITFDELCVEDRWILSRLASVAKRVTESLEQYKFSEAARALYDFAWDEFCSFYVEISKARLSDPERRGVVQNVLIGVLDTLLRLLHPITPFVTEEVWRRLADFAPVRGLEELAQASESITVAPWPIVDEAWIDPNIEAQFAQFQEALRCVRDARARQNVPPRTEVSFAIKCSAEVAELLLPMSEFFKSMACSVATELGPGVVPPALSSNATTSAMEIYVDVADLIDIPAEIQKKEKEIEKLNGFIKSKEAKLSGSFVEKAPAQVVEKERASLEDLRSQRDANLQMLQSLQTAADAKK